MEYIPGTKVQISSSAYQRSVSECGAQEHRQEEVIKDGAQETSQM